MPSNGSVSEFGIPWQVTILLRNPAYGVPEYKPFCGGVILDHKTILTSAQCFYGSERCCAPRNSDDKYGGRGCKRLFSDSTNSTVPCNGKSFAQNGKSFEVIAGVTQLFQDILNETNAKAQVILKYYW